jgi:hypothetical protein
VRWCWRCGGSPGHVGHLAEHPQTLEESWLATNSTRAEGLSFVSPVAYALDWLMFFSDAGKRLTVGIVSGGRRHPGLGGDGAGAAQLPLGRLRRHARPGPPSRGRRADGRGRRDGDGLQHRPGRHGLSTLSLTSAVAAAAMIAGAVAGVKYQAWRMERDAG